MSWSGQHDTWQLILLFFASAGESGYPGFPLVASKVLSYSNYDHSLGYNGHRGECVATRLE